MMKHSMRFAWRRAGTGLAAVGVTLWLAGCAAPLRTPAPVEDRQTASRPVSAPVPVQAPAALGPGEYRVKPGDTLTRIALDHGHSWRDLARWNQLANPDRIEVDQILRVAPPESQAVSSTTIVTPITDVPEAAAAVLTPSAAAVPASVPAATPAAPVSSPSSAAAAAAASSRAMTGDISLAWPAQGPTVAAFDEVRNKGLGIGGKAGDPVLAAADGQVVYAGSGLRGYGNLIIVKHNSTYLTAYAHNQKLLVQEEQRVKQGQKIAEMGNSDADRVKLHFEVRRNGKPVDPAKLLPTR